MNLKQLRTAVKLNRAQLAEMVGKSLPTIRNWEIGKYAPDLHSIPLLANAFGVTTATVIEAALGKNA